MDPRLERMDVVRRRAQAAQVNSLFVNIVAPAVVAFSTARQRPTHTYARHLLPVLVLFSPFFFPLLSSVLFYFVLFCCCSFCFVFRGVFSFPGTFKVVIPARAARAGPHHCHCQCM